MVNLMTGVKNFLEFINNNWTLIVIIFGLFLIVKNKVQAYMDLSEEEKVTLALNAIKNELLKYMSDAELYWDEYKKSGELKKAQVFKDIYNKYPFLATYWDQDYIINEITCMIDEEMDKMNEIINGITPPVSEEEPDGSPEDDSSDESEVNE